MFLFKYFTSFKSINHSPRKNYWENCIYHRHSFLWNFLSSNNRLKNLPQNGWNSSNHSECFWPSSVAKPHEIQTLYCSQGCNQWVWRFIESKLYFIWEGKEGLNELKANWYGKIDLLFANILPWALMSEPVPPYPRENNLQRKMCPRKRGLKMISTTNTQTFLEDFINIHLQQWELYKIQKPELGIRHWYLLWREHTFHQIEHSPLRTKKELS